MQQAMWEEDPNLLNENFILKLQTIHNYMDFMDIVKYFVKKIKCNKISSEDMFQKNLKNYCSVREYWDKKEMRIHL